MIHWRTAYQAGYEDSIDRGMFASGRPRPMDMHDYLRGFRDGKDSLRRVPTLTHRPIWRRLLAWARRRP